MLETAWMPGPVGVKDPKRYAPTPVVATWKRGILVVDDTREVRDTLRAGLWHYGFNVWVVASGPEAVARYRVNGDSIDMVLLDVRMPEWDGPQTLSALRRVDKHVQCCFMTGYSGEYSEADLLRFGALHLFAKPLHIRDVVEVMQARIPTSRPTPADEGRWDDDGGQGVGDWDPMPRASQPVMEVVS